MNSQNEIRSFRGKNAYLSNFYPCNIIYDGMTYKNLEAAFQAAKCSDLTARSQFQSLDPAEAKKLGRTVALRDDWEKIKLIVLSELVRVKFIGFPELLDCLLATGGAYLSEDNTWHDNYYGNCTCTKCQDIPGQNYLGHILMQLREQMRHSMQRFIEGI